VSAKGLYCDLVAVMATRATFRRSTNNRKTQTRRCWRPLRRRDVTTTTSRRRCIRWTAPGEPDGFLAEMRNAARSPQRWRLVGIMPTWPAVPLRWDACDQVVARLGELSKVTRAHARVPLASMRFHHVREILRCIPKRSMPRSGTLVDGIGA